jgi:hypothetical protein
LRLSSHSPPSRARPVCSGRTSLNADGSAGVDADVSVGAKVDAVLPTAIGLAVLGGLLAGLTAWLVTKGSRVRTL